MNTPIIQIITDKENLLKNNNTSTIYNDLLEKDMKL